MIVFKYRDLYLSDLAIAFSIVPVCASINKQEELLRILWLLGKPAFLLLALYYISLINGSEKHQIIRVQDTCTHLETDSVSMRIYSSLFMMAIWGLKLLTASLREVWILGRVSWTVVQCLNFTVPLSSVLFNFLTACRQIGFCRMHLEVRNISHLKGAAVMEGSVWISLYCNEWYHGADNSIFRLLYIAS